MQRGLSFGPLAFELDSPVTSPLLAPFDTSLGGALRVRVRLTSAPSSEEAALLECENPARARLRGPAFSASVDIERRDVEMEVDERTPVLGLLAGLSALVAWRAPREGLVVIHAGAIRTESGVAALLAPPGGGKSTAVLESPGLEFSYNGLLVGEPDGISWPLPFTGGDDPPLDRCVSGNLTIAVCLERSEILSVEPIAPRDATNALLRRVVLLRGDPLGPDAIAVALRLAPRLRWLRIKRPIGSNLAARIDWSDVKGTVRP